MRLNVAHEGEGEEDDELRGVVLEEACEYLGGISAQLQCGGQVDVNEVFRAFHTVKGTTAMVELTLVSKLAHAFENCLTTTRAGDQGLDRSQQLLMGEAVDKLLTLVEGIRDGQEPHEDFGWNELLVRMYTSWQLPEDEAVLAVRELVGAEVAADESSVAAKAGPEQIKVTTDDVDHIMHMIGELLLVERRLRYLVEDGADPEVRAISAEMDQSVNSLYERVLAMKRVPFDTIAGRLGRIIRDVTRREEKNTSFVLEGGELPVDRTVLRTLNEVLVHLLRNAVSHGVELPEQRLHRGKPAQACVRIQVSETDEMVIVEISDDGGGIDHNRVRERAVQVGLLEPEEAMRQTPEQLWPLICAPGFSTASEVTEISGRGVGMDVVMASIEEAGGSMNIHSEFGVGSRFELRLPKEGVPISEGLVVELQDSTWLLPLEDIKQIVRLQDGGITELSSGHRLVRVDKSWLPLLEGQGGPSQPDLVVEMLLEGRSVALAVDRVLGKERVLRRGLPSWIKPPPWMADCFVLGGNEIGFVMDVGGLPQGGRA